jgi:undecaprenyl-phosphate 4-deoxy-4-formamido-L-arabinose transferase
MIKDYKVKFVSIVVPVYNEEACLQELIDRTLKACERLDKDFELILVDDGSVDATSEIMLKASKKHNNVVISCILNRNYGQHNAIFAGFSEVRGDLIITIDADLQNPPEEIPNLVIEAEKGFDVVGTVRQNRQDSLFRKLASSIINFMVRKSTGVNMNDYGCMLRAYRREIVEAMLLCNERSTFIPVLGNSFARKASEIPVKHDERAYGASKYSFWKLINLQFNLLTCMTTFPLRMLSILGSIISMLGIVLAAYLIVMRIINGPEWAVNGVFSLFAVLFVIAGFQLMGMGLLGEYIGRIYDDVRARPKYFIEKIAGRAAKKKN